jgi:rubrerythrin
MEFATLKNVLQCAILKEESSYEMYTRFGQMVKNASAKKLLSDLAGQELGHKRMLEEALASNHMERIGGTRSLADLHLSDYMIVETVTPDSEPQHVMLFAMKREQESYDAYRELLENYGGTELEPLFSRLAQEELRHKIILEREYQEHFAQWF